MSYGEPLCFLSGWLLVIVADLSPVPQQAWIHSGSVRDNITFSARREEIDFARLNAVIDACALRTDLQAMSDGDL